MGFEEVDDVDNEQRIIFVRHLPILPAAIGCGEAVVESQFVELDNDDWKGAAVTDPVVELAKVGRC